MSKAGVITPFGIYDLPESKELTTEAINEICRRQDIIRERNEAIDRQRKPIDEHPFYKGEWPPK